MNKELYIDFETYKKIAEPHKHEKASARRPERAMTSIAQGNALWK